MRFEDLIIEKSETTIEKSRLLENRLIAIRNKNRGELLSKITNGNHKLEPVRTFCGVSFIDDSKSENINATYYAIEQIKNSIVWIIGCDDSQANYEKLQPFINQKIRALICFGNQNEKIQNIFKEKISNIVKCSDMNIAVRKAFYNAQKGDVVLFSSACSCGNLYENYQQRGEAFKNAIAQL